ncbi:2-dehydro-3-deoxy-6-phosphogalactonate aldolase [Asticcacaulis benevestitus]|uniref:2-dehydro-3-deoxy-6-phosphogalactonate aldolase n=1 Tax=Asticcacaulis benevestitus DSM 16100 = ATCC BAA-896 TaxID=1121022 RepID=V4R5T5_9CAUL|nr:2-dehydro-3-deoxy-6-phosphogalactonate aldolase [Asticcacaulis benevestitus]ESQ86823.1 2-dehydro-3-deoxy-6-phosphogalactonate aldolase [Asticcacaulis benevestitus DSM 16100 = ATCC BAA-896]
MTLNEQWQDALRTLPLVAILRGLRPDEALGVGEMLVEAGFKIVEVPLNSPEPFDSIKLLAQALGKRAIVGGGTVLNVASVETLHAVGGQICISPNANPDVIRRTKQLGMISFPAFFTPTEAFSAIDAGADAIKLFPAELAGTTGLKAMKAVLPKDLPVFPVGGVTPDNMKDFIDAGAAGFGIGSAVFKPGDTPEIVYNKAKAFVDGWNALHKA